MDWTRLTLRPFSSTSFDPGYTLTPFELFLVKAPRRTPEQFYSFSFPGHNMELTFVWRH